MRAIWTGSLNFGLVNIPVKLYSAVNDTSIDFDMLDKKDLSPIKYQKISKATGKEVPYSDIVKGYKFDGEHYVVLTDEDFQKASVEKTKTIDIVDFVKDEEIDSIYYEKPYYLEPDKNAAKPYSLLKDALIKSEMVGVAFFVLRNRQHLAIVKPMGNILVLNQLRFADEIRNPEELKTPGNIETKGKELDMALALIDQLSVKFQPENYKDTYTEDLMKLINEKAKGKVVKARGEEPEPSKVKDLMSLLKDSLKVQKKSKKTEKETA